MLLLCFCVMFSLWLKCENPILFSLLCPQSELRDKGELLMFQLGFDSEAFGLVFFSDYKAKVLAGEQGRVTQGTVEKFLEKVLPSCTELSFSKDKMLKEFLFTDSEITYEWTEVFTSSFTFFLFQWNSRISRLFPFQNSTCKRRNTFTWLPLSRHTKCLSWRAVLFKFLKYWLHEFQVAFFPPTSI